MLLTNLFQNLREHAIASNTLSFAEELAPFDLVRSLRHLEFDEAGQQLKALLEKGYRDGIDGLEEVRVEGDKIKGIFIDKVTSSLTKRYEFTIDESAIKYKLLNPSAVEQADFTELEFARTKLAGDTKKVKSCPKGTPCRFSCIAKGKECSYTPSADEKGEITFLKQKIGNKKTKATADIDNKSAIKYDDKKAGNTSTAAAKKSSKNMNTAEKSTEVIDSNILDSKTKNVFELHIQALRGDPNLGTKLINKLGLAATVADVDADKAFTGALQTPEFRDEVYKRYEKLVESPETAEKLTDLQVKSSTTGDIKSISKLAVALDNAGIGDTDVYDDIKRSPEFERLLLKEYSKLSRIN